MSFRDDFNELNSSVWETVNYFGDKASINITNGKLDLRVTEIASGEEGWWGIHKISTVNLTNKKIEVSLDFEIAGSGGPNFHFGIFISNLPFTERANPQFRGEYVGLDGTGRRDARVLFLHYLRGGEYEHIPVSVTRVPCVLRVKVAEKAVYIFEVVNGTEKALVSRPIDYATDNLHLYVMTRAYWYIGIQTTTASVYIDYIDIKEEKVPETVQEAIAKELVSIIALMISGLIPFTLVILTLLEVRRTFKEVRRGG